jgi:hypothetical protein
MGKLHCPPSRNIPLERLDARFPFGSHMKKHEGKIELSPLIQVGEGIRQARKARRMTTLEVARITRIPERYVRCIEAGEFVSLPGKPYAFGFTRTICALLGLDADPYIQVIRSEMYASCPDEPGIHPAGASPGAMLRRFALGRRG